MKSLFLILAILALANADIKEHLVTDLTDVTGYGKPWYSGYLDISTETNAMKSHYFFFPSQTSPESDPVLLWLNGGPGCSSLLGASQENGPWVFETDSTDIKLNPYAWNMRANVIYIESPPGVGFSTTENYKWDDSTTAQVNLSALLQFFKNYPEYKNRQFFISGESYAGIYIPTLADAIVEHNLQAPTSEKINLKGILVGNGCTDPSECSFNGLVNPYEYEVFSSQGFFTPDQEQSYIDNCGPIGDPTSDKLGSTKCFLTAQSQLSTVSGGVNIYNLIGTCYYQDIPNFSGINPWIKEQRSKFHQMVNENPAYAKIAGLTPEEVLERRVLSERNVSSDLPPCTDGIGPQTFFNTQSVKKALHVEENIHWGMCNNKVTMSYTRSKTGSYHLYHKLIQSGIRAWIYSGDVDGAVPTSGTLYWTQKLNKEQKYENIVPWRAWYTNGIQEGNRQNAGQFWRTEGITVITFKGCGHMVPEDNYIGGYDMVNAFLNGEDLPAY